MSVKDLGPHGITRYRSGCRCDTCRASAAEAKRRQRAARPDVAKNVVSLPITAQLATEPISMGPNERAVRAECELLPRAAERPAIVQAAITVAQRLDDTAHAAMTARNAHELRDLLEQLKGPKKKSAGRLVQISAMAGKKAQAH